MDTFTSSFQGNYLYTHLMWQHNWLLLLYGYRLMNQTDNFFKEIKLLVYCFWGDSEAVCLGGCFWFNENALQRGSHHLGLCATQCAKHKSVLDWSSCLLWARSYRGWYSKSWLEGNKMLVIFVHTGADLKTWMEKKILKIRIFFLKTKPQQS